MKEADLIVGNTPEFLKFLRTKFTLIHLSNFFFRDFHYGVMLYLQGHRKKVNYQDAEKIAVLVGEAFERSGIFKRIDHQSWLLHYPEFALPKAEKKAS